MLFDLTNLVLNILIRLNQCSLYSREAENLVKEYNKRLKYTNLTEGLEAYRLFENTKDLFLCITDQSNSSFYAKS
ncbi:hypothetical protein Hdeb2414_s0024g00647161 [Helianthus debilis subsp. tardiflorus]